MSVFGASRFTALLAAIAISGTAGTFWWALDKRSDTKSGVGDRSANRALPSKPAGRASHSKDERSNKFELMGRSERPQPGSAGGGESRDQSPERSAPSQVLVNIPGSGPRSGADMPLPLLPAPSNPWPWQVQTTEQVTPPGQPPALAPPPAENQKRQTREPRPEPTAAAPRSPKPRSFYLEKFVEQGDAGEVKYRYRRRACEPPNMPDVCFMPPEARHAIVVAKP